MPTLYGAGLSPFVRKVRVVLAEKNVAHDHDPVVPFNVSDEYKRISPLGKIPAYRDGDLALADSSAICAYLEKVHAKPALYPSDPADFGRALWFEEWADTALAQVVGAKIFFPRVVAPRFFNQPADETAIAQAIATDVPPLFDYLEGQLGDREWLVGNAFSIADVAVGSLLANFRLAGESIDATRWPKLARYVARVHERPSFRTFIAEDRGALGLS